MSLEATCGLPSTAVCLVGGGTLNLHFVFVTGSKWTATNHLSDLEWLCDVDQNISVLCRAFFPRKKRDKHNNVKATDYSKAFQTFVYQ